MVIIQEKNIKKHLRKVDDLHSFEKFNPILVSEVKKVENIDPLSFFTSGRKYFPGQRFYWTDPTNHTVIVGVGYAHTIEVNKSSDRFGDVDRQWKQILANRYRTNDDEVIGTGPMLFGGFSFDPLGKRTSLWEKFPDAKFIMPTIMLSIIDGESWLTTNYFCNDRENENRFSEDLENVAKGLLEESGKVVANNSAESPYDKTEVMPEEWKASVSKIADKIQAGEVEKVVLAREIRLQFDQTIDAAVVIATLREQQPMSYTFAFENGDDCFVGASPERLVRKKNNELLSTCLAGSIKRGKSLKEDDELGNILLKDKKNIIEHEVVVHMIKEAMSEACDKLEVPNKPSLYKMRDIQHLYTPVKGIVKDGVSLLSMVQRLHPTPALGGFPKEVAMQQIREIEVLDRGWYAGPIGWFDGNDNGEFAVAIRSALLQSKEASLFAGCGIVGDSQPESEFQETEIKFKPMLYALGGEKNDSK